MKQLFDTITENGLVGWGVLLVVAATLVVSVWATLRGLYKEIEDRDSFYFKEIDDDTYAPRRR